MPSLKETHIPCRQPITVTIGDARKMTGVADRSIDLVVTSPPYPMIQMWDNLFGRLDPAVTAALKQHRGMAAFELMHTGT